MVGTHHYTLLSPPLCCTSLRARNMLYTSLWGCSNYRHREESFHLAVRGLQELVSHVSYLQPDSTGHHGSAGCRRALRIRAGLKKGVLLAQSHFFPRLYSHLSLIFFFPFKTRCSPCFGQNELFHCGKTLLGRYCTVVGESLMGSRLCLLLTM